MSYRVFVARSAVLYGLGLVAFCLFSSAPQCRAEDSQSAVVSQPLIRADQTATIVCLGDSVTGVYYHTGGHRAYPEMLEIAIAKALRNTHVKVINAGISGNTTGDGLTRLDIDVLQHHPDLVTISFGLNDMVRVPEEQFQKNLEALVSRCRDAKSQVVLCTPNSVVTTTARPIEKLRVYCDLIRQIGKKLNVPVCDQFAAGEAQQAQDPWAWRLTLSDEIHPNMDGHKLMAEELCRTITGNSVSLADVPPPEHPLATTEALWKAGQPVKVLAMPPFDALIRPALEQNYPGIVVQVTPWTVEGKSLPEIEVMASQTVRAMKPNLVVLAVPLSANADSDEQFVRSYAWVMNWSLSFGQAEWDCVVVHPSVASESDSAPQGEQLVARQVKAQDLHLINRAHQEKSSPAELLTRWIEKHRAPQ